MEREITFQIHIMNNVTCFRAEESGTLLEQCGVVPNNVTYWRPRSNGIIERHHRTIKDLAGQTKLGHILALY